MIKQLSQLYIVMPVGGEKIFIIELFYKFNFIID